MRAEPPCMNFKLKTESRLESFCGGKRSKRIQQTFMILCMEVGSVRESLGAGL